MEPTTTSRRAFLKSGAVVAAPLAAALPVAALAADDSAARLARIEDERSIEALQRDLLRQLSGGASRLGDDVRRLAQDHAHEASVEIADDGRSASARCACQVEREVAFTGDTTLERMARHEGLAKHHHQAPAVLATQFVKSADGWHIASSRLV